MEDLLRTLLRPTIALLLSPLGLVLISATRLLIVADDRPSTAIAIASSGGYVNTLLGTLIPILPIFIPYIALIFLFFRRFLLSAVSFLAAAFISPAQIHTTRPLASYTRTDILASNTELDQHPRTRRHRSSLYALLDFRQLAPE